MVQMESVVSGHTFNTIRERLADKLEMIRFDPYSKYINIYSYRILNGFILVQMESLYKEKKRVRSM